MTGGADRWRQIEDLYRASLDIPEDERDAFLRAKCGADDQLRMEVERLLADDVEESPLIASIVDNATSGLLENDSEEPPTATTRASGA